MRHLRRSWHFGCLLLQGVYCAREGQGWLSKDRQPRFIQDGSFLRAKKVWFQKKVTFLQIVLLYCGHFINKVPPTYRFKQDIFKITSKKVSSVVSTLYYQPFSGDSALAPQKVMVSGMVGSG